jgi:carbamoyl-phosphate synthase large subunit
MQEPDFSQRSLLVTGACGVTSRTIVRALRRSPRFARTRLVGIDVCDNPFALHEGLYARIWRVPRLDEPGRYRELVTRICERERLDAAIVVPEPEVLFWAEHAMPVPALLPPPAFARHAISKARVYESLRGTGLVPAFDVLPRAAIAAGEADAWLGRGAWLRDVSEGSTSGKGALHVRHPDEARAWLTLNPTTERFMVSDYLPGRNLACLLLFHDGELVKTGSYERLEYFMARTAVSGVTGNICQGRLVNDGQALAVSLQAVSRLCAMTGERMSGLVTVDLRCDAQDRPRITEINLRQVAAASAFAEVPGANLAEAQVLLALGRADLVGPREVRFSPHTRLLRDIDGTPVYVDHFRPLAVGEALDATLAADPMPEGALA